MAFLLLFACRKKEVGTDLDPARKGHKLFAFQTDLFPLLQGIYYSSKGPEPGGGPSLCGNIQLVDGDTALFPDQNSLTYRYRPVDSCEGPAGADRNGELKVTYNGSIEEAGSKVLIKSEGHASGGTELVGRITVHREDGHWLYVWKRSRYRIEGKEVSVRGSMKVEELQGAGTDSLQTDDRYRFAPEMKGEGIGDPGYRIEGREWIERDMGCRWAWKGNLWIKPRDLGARKLDYGDGQKCSDSLIIRVNGKAFPIAIDPSSF
ncbi:MAG: hypothetical protein ABEH38_06475 [Flavobacteriales bacterium]